MRETFVVYEFNQVNDVFASMRKEHATLAIVLDEYGVLSGIVSFEDIVEEIVGEIDDEYDDASDDIVKINDHEYLVDGSLNLNEVNDEIDTHFESDDFESIGCFVLGEFSGVPKIKDKVESGDFQEVKYSCILREGIPEEEILRYAKEQRPKLIIMGTRGKNQKDIDLIGSVTAEVIDRNRTAVLAIPENTPFKQFSEVKQIAFITNFDQRDLIAFDAFFNSWKSFHFSVSLIHLAESKDTWNEIKLVGIKEYFHKQYPGLEIHYDVVMSDNLLKGLEQYIKDNQIDIIALTSYKRNIFARLFNPSIARKMIFHSDTPLLVMNG